MTYYEYPRMIYHPVQEPVIVMTKEELEEYVAKGWTTDTGKRNEIAYLESVIKKTEDELKTMRNNLRFLKSEGKANKENL